MERVLGNHIYFPPVVYWCGVRILSWYSSPQLQGDVTYLYILLLRNSCSADGSTPQLLYLT